ncbi:hypothetical protein V4886_25165, partial [Ralstonia solanacearum species complex bacterium RW470]|uniref:hypothetical protein n=1 Tax=Ralstonia solanacearum species complex bacterium RW470 TaxID=3119580 RepID=UPI002FC2E4FD
EIFFTQLKLPVIKKTASGAPSTDEEVLQKLAEDYPLPKLLLELQQALAQPGALPGQALGIDQHAVALHLLQHDGGRHLDL